MIKITIEGPQGSGKTKIANAIIRYLGEKNLAYNFNQNNMVIKNPDVLIIEKQK